MIRKSISPKTKDLMKKILKIDDEKRFNIDQILEHPAIQDNIEEFSKPLS